MHWTPFTVIALTGTLLDVATKYIAFHVVGVYQSHEVIPGVLEFKTLYNKGIIFGIAKDMPWAGWIFLIISVLAVPVILYLFATIKKSRWVLTFALGLILAGTCGNMYDRLFTILGLQAFEGVRDFIYVSLIDWPIFNLADAFICTGVFLLTLDILFTREPQGTSLPAPSVSTQGAPDDQSREVINPSEGQPGRQELPPPSTPSENE